MKNEDISLDLSVDSRGFVQGISGVDRAVSALGSALESVRAHLTSFAGAIFGSAEVSKKTVTALDKQTNAIKRTATAAKSASKMLQAFDEINQHLLASSSGSTSSSTKSSSETPAPSAEPTEPLITEPDLSWTDKLRSALASIADWVSSSFGPTFSKAVSAIAPNLAAIKANFIAVWSDILKLGSPMKNWLEVDFVPFLQQFITTAGQIIAGLTDTFNTVFSSIRAYVIKPFLDTLAADILPFLSRLATELVTTAGAIFEQVKAVFDTLWRDAATPALELLSKVWSDAWESISTFWNKWGAPIFESIRTAINSMGEVFSSAWKSVIKPVFDAFMSAADKLWSDHLKDLLAKFLEMVGTLITSAGKLYSEFIAPISKWLLDTLGPAFSSCFSGAIKAAGTLLGGLADVAAGIIEALTGVITFITGVFTGDWSKAWNGVKSIFSGVWNAMRDMAKNAANAAIDAINGLIRGVTAGMNAAIRAINSIRIMMPDWIPGVGGKYFGFNIRELTAAQIPRLATGGIISAPTIAMVGERGREAVLPLENNTAWMDTLAGKLANSILPGIAVSLSSLIAGTSGNAGRGDLVLEISGAELARVSLNDFITEAGRIGVMPVRA